MKLPFLKNILWTAKEAEKATGGNNSDDWRATGVSIDSRTINKGDLFVALSGDNFDGHNFIDAAFNRGAAAAIVSKKLDTQHPTLTVENTQKALCNLATFRRNQANTRIIAITGSVGKTSVKEALNLVLSKQGVTHATYGNLNNHIGLPLTLSRMPKNCDYGVFELGMNHAGELSKLTKLLKPHVAVITAIEAVHLEFFDSVEAIVDAKSEIFKGVEEGGAAVLPFDSPYFDRLQKAALDCGIKDIISFGMNDGANVRCYNSDEGNIRVSIAGLELTYKLNMYGKHQIINSLAVLAAVKASDADIIQATKSLEKLEPPAGRGRFYKLVTNHELRIIIIDDSYNASPASMRAALAVLGNQNGRKIAVLGDMLELGDKAVEYHTSLSNDIIANNVDLVFTAGNLMFNLHKVLPVEIRGEHKNTAKELLSALKNSFKDGDVVLIKGSHGSNMWQLAEELLFSQAANHQPLKSIS